MVDAVESIEKVAEAAEHAGIKLTPTQKKWALALGFLGLIGGGSVWSFFEPSLTKAAGDAGIETKAEAAKVYGELRDADKVLGERMDRFEKNLDTVPAKTWDCIKTKGRAKGCQ